MPEPEKDVMQEFLSDLQLEGPRNLDEITAPEGSEPAAETAPETEKQRERREVRRLKAQLQQEKDFNIAQAERIKMLSETQKFRTDTNSEDIDDSIARIYGTNTPEAKEATRLLQKALEENSKRSVDQALERFREEQRQSQSQVSAFQSEIENYIEEIEDEYGVDMTSDTAGARKLRENYLNLLEKLSPKENGLPTAYADPRSTWELMQSMSTKSASTMQAKELGARSMTRSSASSTKAGEDSTYKYLRDHGIL